MHPLHSTSLPLYATFSHTIPIRGTEVYYFVAKCGKNPPTYVLLQGTAHGLVILIAIILIKHSVTGDVASKPNSLDISQGTHSDPLSELPGEPQGPQRPLVF